MKKLYLLLLSLVVGTCYGQLMVSYQLPYNGITSKSQLWNISIMNPDGFNGNINIEIAVSDAVTGELVFSGKSSVYNLYQKITQLNAASLSPITYYSGSSSYNLGLNPDGPLPVGRFSVCCTLFLEGNAKGEQECTDIEIEPLGPPILISPENQQATDSRRPFFTWMPPSPITGFTNLNYNFSLVTVEPLQTPEEAIQSSLPVFNQNLVSTNSILYPPSFPELDTSKLYAWQVTAVTNNTEIIRSEVFTFKVRQYDPDTAQLKAPADWYAPLKRENDAVCYIFDNEIKYQFINESNDSICEYNLYDITASVPRTVIQGAIQQQVKFGQNFLVLNVQNNSKFLDKHIYLLEFLNSKKEKWYLKFEYRKKSN